MYFLQCIFFNKMPTPSVSVSDIKNIDSPIDIFTETPDTPALYRFK